MKRHGNLFSEVFSHDNMYAAYLDARKGKRKKSACHEFDVAAGALLYDLRGKIHAGLYRVRAYHHFFVCEPKKREISAPWFGDIVVQHAIYRIIKPIFDRCYIAESFACRVGKGTHKASDYTQSALMASRDGTYTLKLDIRKFFYRIDRTILRRLIERKIKDARLVDIMMMFAEDGKNEIGIPIGNLLSQTYALIYLNELDHFIKRDLLVKKYCRYVDDLVLFDLTRDECVSHRDKIEAFISQNLALEYSKWGIQKTKRGINFIGYRTWKTARFIRKYSLLKFRRAVTRGKTQSIISLLGHAKNSSSLRWMLAYLEKNWDNKNGSNPARIADKWG